MMVHRRYFKDIMASKHALQLRNFNGEKLNKTKQKIGKIILKSFFSTEFEIGKRKRSLKCTKGRSFKRVGSQDNFDNL